MLPPLLGIAVKVTFVPGHTAVSFVVILTLGSTVLAVTVNGLEVVMFGAAHERLLVSVQVMVLLLSRGVLKTELLDVL